VVPEKYEANKLLKVRVKLLIMLFMSILHVMKKFTCQEKFEFFRKNRLLTDLRNLHTINLVTRNLPVNFFLVLNDLTRRSCYLTNLFNNIVLKLFLLFFQKYLLKDLSYKLRI